jgi:hypothetical protein
MSTSTPAAKPSKFDRILEKVRHEIVIVLTAAVTIGEAVLQAVPSGTVTTTLQILLPVLSGAALKAKTLPLVKVEQLIGQLAHPKKR